MRKNFFLKTERIGLRMITAEDIDWYAEWFNDAEVCNYNSHHRFPKSRQSMETYVQSVTNSNSVIVFALIDLKSGTHFGNISLQEINYIDRSAELAFLIGEKEYWKKGYASEASEVIIKHAFEELNLHRLYLATSDENVPMQKLAKKLGFSEEGCRREALFKHGVYHDIIEFGLISSEVD
ncbi:MAG: GNAT family N-acetyltransferase [Lachnospiraceae bacterium]|nr:GNAT family N-acetyltransferase [Lachnospiraceae bacterium]